MDEGASDIDEQASDIKEESVEGEEPISFQSKDSFIDATVNKQMSMYLPQPTSQYYCIYCNYLEFMLRDQLIEHQHSQDHKKREASYESLFCKTCQVHSINVAGFRTHSHSNKHKTLTQMYKKHRKEAGTLWDKTMKSDEVIRKKVDDGLKHHPAVTEFYEKANAFLSETYKLDDFLTHGYKLTSRMTAALLQKEYPSRPHTFYCNTCDLPFDKHEDIEAHRKTESHHEKFVLKDTAIKRCKECRLNGFDNDKYAAHVKTEEHHVMKKKILVARRLSGKFVKLLAKKATFKIQDQLYPPSNDFFVDGVCKLCPAMMCTAIPLEELEQHKLSSSHQHRLWSFYIKKRNNMIKRTDCDLCGENTAESEFEKTAHYMSLEHLTKLKEYRQLIGLIEHFGNKIEKAALKNEENQLNTKQMLSSTLITDNLPSGIITANTSNGLNMGKRSSETITDPPSIDLTTDPPSIDLITDPPSSDLITDPPSIDLTSDKLSSDLITHKPSTDLITDKPSTDLITDKPSTDLITDE